MIDKSKDFLEMTDSINYFRAQLKSIMRLPPASKCAPVNLSLLACSLAGLPRENRRLDKQTKQQASLKQKKLAY